MYKKIAIVFFTLTMILSSVYAEDRDEFGKTELYKAVDAEDFVKLKEIVEDDDDEINSIANNGNSPLMVACMKGNFEIIKYLIENGADINYQKEDNSYALYQLVGYQNLSNDKDYLSMVKYMIEKGADYNKIGFNNYSLIHASKDINITKYLIELGMDIHAVSKNNATTLVGSVANDGKGSQIPKYLISLCVDLNATAKFDDVEINAYDVAIKIGRLESAKIIKEAMQNKPEQCRGTKIIAPIVDLHNLPKSFDSNKTKISIMLRAQGSGIGMSRFFVNGVELFNIDNNSSGEDENIKTYDVNLTNGANVITAYAFDKSNTVKSEVMTYTINYGSETFSINEFKFVVKKNSIFVNIKDKVKRDFRFTNDKGKYKVVLDLDSKRFTKYGKKDIETPGFENVKVGYHRKFYRLAIQTKDKRGYDLKVTKEGIEIVFK